MRINSSQIIYSEHDYDECFEYKNEKGRVPDGVAVGYELYFECAETDSSAPKVILFSDIKYSQYDHQYWDNLELESDPNRLII